MDLDYEVAPDEWKSVVSSKMLLIEDAKTLKAFLTNARALWIRRHDPKRQRGRPSERADVFKILWNHELRRPVARHITQGGLIRLVQNTVEAERSPQDVIKQDAIRKYVRMWVILKRTGKVFPDLELPRADIKYFDKHASKTMKAIRNYLRLAKSLSPGQKFMKGWHLTRTAAIDGTLDIGALFHLPPTSPQNLDVEKELRAEIADFLPPTA
ncbi:MAG: hypothetical protein H8K03_04230 [Nitrospira sp.]